MTVDVSGSASKLRPNLIADPTPRYSVQLRVNLQPHYVVLHDKDLLCLGRRRGIAREGWSGDEGKVGLHGT